MTVISIQLSELWDRHGHPRTKAGEFEKPGSAKCQIKRSRSDSGLQGGTFWDQQSLGTRGRSRQASRQRSRRPEKVALQGVEFLTEKDHAEDVRRGRMFGSQVIVPRKRIVIRMKAKHE